MAVASGTARYITSAEFGLVSCRGLSISFFHSALKVKHTLLQIIFLLIFFESNFEETRNGKIVVMFK